MTGRQVFDTVDDAVYAVGHYSDVPLKAQANTLGIPASRLNDYVDATRKPMFPASLVAPHAKAAHNFSVVRTICKDAGGVFVPIPTGLGDNREIVIALAGAIREVGDVASKVGTDLADGTITPLEARASLDEIDQAIAKLAGLRALLAKKADRKQ